MTMSAEHRSKFAAHIRQWWRLHMSEKFSSGTINSIKKHPTIILRLLHLNKQEQVIERTDFIHIDGKHNHIML